MAYLYETHMHTCQASACSDTPGHDYIQRYIDLGYDGIIITDHFYRGNCCVDRSLPWREFVNRFCSGYEDARNEGEKRGLSVFFGWEENIRGDEYLIYGPDKQFMLDHPEMVNWSRKAQYEAVKAAGGCVIQAHPFRARSYLDTIRLAPHFADGIEGVNAHNHPRWDSLAMRYGQRLGVPITVGSDNHHARETDPSHLAAVALEQPLTCIQDYVSVILEGKPIGMRGAMPPPWTPEITPDLPTEWFDENERVMDVDVMAYLGTFTK